MHRRFGLLGGCNQNSSLTTDLFPFWFVYSLNLLDRFIDFEPYLTVQNGIGYDGLLQLQRQQLYVGE